MWRNLYKKDVVKVRQGVRIPCLWVAYPLLIPCCGVGIYNGSTMSEIKKRLPMVYRQPRERGWGIS